MRILLDLLSKDVLNSVFVEGDDTDGEVGSVKVGCCWFECIVSGVVAGGGGGTFFYRIEILITV